MEDCFLHDVTTLEVLHYYPLEKLGSHAGVPHTFGIDNDYRPTLAHSKAWSLAALYPIRSEQQSFALKQRRQQRIQRAAAPFRRAIPTGADDDVAGIRFHRPW
jgi:hypothetical protein